MMSYEKTFCVDNTHLAVILAFSIANIAFRQPSQVSTMALPVGSTRLCGMGVRHLKKYPFPK